MAPDLEIPIIFLLTRGLPHAHQYPISFFFRHENERVEERCRFSVILVFSCTVEGLSHVLIDSMTHEFNSVFFPFFDESFDALVLTNDRFLASVIIECALLILLILHFVNKIRKGNRGFWTRILVE